uniref:Neuronal membrane glycoprotein M6-b-like n=1 Tax=Oncorhynchus kisutch TaxID=8019 RepID=A0A8C7GB14_ONCKI
MESTTEENQEEREESKGCFECCIKCLGGVPYASLVATILCFSGVALFCGCGHVALTGTLTMLENHFSQITTDHATLTIVIQTMQYVIYGIASFFFVYGIILLAEGFYTTSAVKKELQSQFKTTVCGRCITATVRHEYTHTHPYGHTQIWSRMHVYTHTHTHTHIALMNTFVAPKPISLVPDRVGIIPWNATPGKACGSTLGDICSTSEFYLSFHLYIVACAGAGATLIALLIYMMATTYNYAVLKFMSHGGRRSTKFSESY